MYIRSSNGWRALSGPYRPIGALQSKPSPLRQDCDPLRWELAITGLDWFLTPNPRSGDRFARQDPCRPPAGFRPPSSYPGLDRPVSSLTAMTKDPFRSFASPKLREFGFPPPPLSQKVRLAMTAISLETERTTLEGFSSLRNLHPIPSELRTSVTGWFQELFTPLPGYFSTFPHGTSILSVLMNI